MTDEVTDLETYQYTTMPLREGDVLRAEVRREKYDSSKLLFESEDDGITWRFIEYHHE